MAKMGRPRKVIDADQFEKLCGIHCTLSDIAGFFDCSEDTIERWCKETYRNEAGEPLTFAEAYKLYSAVGNVSLRRLQFKHAEKSPGMAIFLGKQYLGQKDVQDMTITNSDAQAKFAEILEIWKSQGDPDEMGQ